MQDSLKNENRPTRRDLYVSRTTPALYMYIHIYVYIYIYLQKKRERERKRESNHGEKNYKKNAIYMVNILGRKSVKTQCLTASFAGEELDNLLKYFI